jgi:hypothetical protein
VTVQSETVVTTAASLVAPPITLDPDPPILRSWLHQEAQYTPRPAMKETIPQPDPAPEPQSPSHRR